MRCGRPGVRDKVLVPAIPLKARVGCSEEERREPQRILVDIELRCDLGPAARSDAVADAIDYVRVRAEAESVAAARPYALIETIAQGIADRLLEAFPAGEACVRVRKPAALAEHGVPWAAVEVVRSSHG